MVNGYWRVSFALLGLGVAAFVGCGGDADEKIPIEGTVLVDGKPMDGASVTFIGGGGGAFSSASTDAKGVFRLRAAAGKNKVAVSKPMPAPTSSGPALETMPTEAELAKIVKSVPKPYIAERFADPSKSGIEIEVSKGMQPVDINVSAK